MIQRSGRGVEEVAHLPHHLLFLLLWEGGGVEEVPTEVHLGDCLARILGVPGLQFQFFNIF